jgi:hypothetical protein
MKRRKRTKSRSAQWDGNYRTIQDSGYISDNILEHLLSNAQKVKSLIPLLEAFKMKIGEFRGRLTVISKAGG